MSRRATLCRPTLCKTGKRPWPPPSAITEAHSLTIINLGVVVQGGPVNGLLAVLTKEPLRMRFH